MNIIQHASASLLFKDAVGAEVTPKFSTNKNNITIRSIYMEAKEHAESMG